MIKITEQKVLGDIGEKIVGNYMSKIGRKVSFTNRKSKNNNIEIIKSEISKIKKKKPDEMKQELEARGIKVSGKSTRLLRDIYLYTKTSGIQINHEK